MSICCIIGCKSKQKILHNTITDLIIPYNLMDGSKYICTRHAKYYKYLGKICELCDNNACNITNNIFMCDTHYRNHKYKNESCSIEGCKNKVTGNKIDGEYVCNTHFRKYKYKKSTCSIYGCHNKMAVCKKLYIATDPIKKKNSGYMCLKHYRKYNLNIIKYIYKTLKE